MRRADKPPSNLPEVKASSRDQLIAAASDLMIRRDTLDITLNDIAAEAGLNGGLVKYYFGSKDGLLLAVLLSVVMPGLLALQRLLAAEIAPRRKLERHISGIVATYCRFTYLNRLLRYLVERPETPECSLLNDTFVRPFIAAQSRLLAQAVDAGEVRPVDPLLLYIAVSGACEAVVDVKPTLQQIYGFQDISPAFRAWYTQAVLAMVMNGLLVRHDPVYAMPAGPAPRPSGIGLVS